MDTKSVSMVPHIRQSIVEATFIIDRVASIRYAQFVPNFQKVVDTLKADVKRDVKIIAKAKAELEELEEIAERIYALQEQLGSAEMRVVHTLEMLRDKQLTDSVIDHPALERVRQYLSTKRAKEVTLRVATEQYLRIVRKAKVAEIVEFLQAIGFDYAKRQTIEGLIKRHPFDFSVVKEGREKFITARRSLRRAGGWILLHRWRAVLSGGAVRGWLA